MTPPDPMREALEKLIAWDKKYPKSYVMNDYTFKQHEKELDEIVKQAQAALAGEAGGVETVRYGYEYSPANDAYEIAPIGIDGELDWDNEVCITANGDEAVAKLIVGALNAPHPAERERGDIDDEEGRCGGAPEDYPHEREKM